MPILIAGPGSGNKLVLGGPKHSILILGRAGDSPKLILGNETPRLSLGPSQIIKLVMGGDNDPVLVITPPEIIVLRMSVPVSPIQQGEANTAANVGACSGEVFRDKTGLTLNLRTIDGVGDIGVATVGDCVEISTSALAIADHRTLRHLIHFISGGPADGFLSGAYREILPAASPFPTSVTWWESSAKLKKYVEKLITRTGGPATNIKPTPVVWHMYAADGVTVAATVSDAITYSGVFETSRTRAIT